MKPPLTVYCYQLSLAKRLEGTLSLSGLRVGLFLYMTSFRYPGSSLAIALLLFLVGTLGEPLDLNHPEASVALLLIPRMASIVLGLAWMSIVFCRVSLQLVNASSWRRELQQNEENFRHRISTLEEWLVLPTHRACHGMVEVGYEAKPMQSPSREI